MAKISNDQQWALNHKKPDTELKIINRRYYLYEVKSIYDKTLKRAKKISGSILGRITESEGFIPSEKKILKERSVKPYLNKDILYLEYGYAT